MYGTALYGKENFCEFTFDSGFYGVPEAHVVNIGASALAVPGAEAPSSSAGAVLSGLESETPYTSITFAEDAIKVDTVGTLLGDVGVPGEEAPSTVNGLVLEGPLFAPLLTPYPPRYMFSETFVTGTPTPLMYEMALYDDHAWEEPFTTYTVNSYNTGMAIASCLMGGDLQRMAGGFEFGADSLGDLYTAHNMRSAAVAAQETNTVETLISNDLAHDGREYLGDASAGLMYTWEARPNIPQMVREATQVAELINPKLDTTTLVPMSLGGDVMQVITCPDGPVIVPAHLATDKNGMFYKDTGTSDSVIYGSRYTYLYRGAQYLGISTWKEFYIDGNKVAGVLPGLIEAQLICSGSMIGDIYVDYLFALQETVTAMSFGAPSIDITAGETLPTLLYGYETYLGRSAMYNAIQKALGLDTTATMALTAPNFDGGYSIVAHPGALPDVLYGIDVAPGDYHVDTAVAISVNVAGYVCDRDDPALQFADTVGVWSAYAEMLPAAQFTAEAAPLCVAPAGFDGGYDPYFALAEMADALSGQDAHVTFTYIETCDLIVLSMAKVGTDNSAAVAGAELDAMLFSECAPVAHLEDSAAPVIDLADAAFLTPHSMEVDGTLIRVEDIPQFYGATRNETYLTLASLLEAVFVCRDASPLLDGALFYELPVSVARNAGDVDVAQVSEGVRFILSDRVDGNDSTCAIPGEILYVREQAAAAAPRLPDYTYNAYVVLADFACGFQSRELSATVIEGVQEVVTAGFTFNLEPDVFLANVVFAEPDVDRENTEFSAYELEIRYTPIDLRGVVTATVAYGVAGCAFSAAEFDGNVLAECIYINLTPTPFWYDFVIEYDYSDVSDPTDMAFIF